MQLRFTFSLLLSTLVAQAQYSFSYNHSPNGEPILDSYDSFFHHEYGGLTYTYEDAFTKDEKGVFQLKGEGAKPTPAIIAYDQNHKIRVRTSYYSDSRRIDADELLYFKTELDSFFVTEKVSLKKGPLSKPAILQYLGSSEIDDYAMYYSFGMNGLKDKMIVFKAKDDSSWTYLKLNEERPKNILAQFFSNEKLIRYYDKQELTIEEFLNSLKIEEYYKKYKNGSDIYYDKLWREVKKPEKAIYYGKITDVRDSIFSVSIRDAKDQKLYDLDYSSLHPRKQTGKMTVYNESGGVRMERNYDQGDLISTRLFNENEKAIFSTDYLNFKATDEKPAKALRRFTSIGDDTISSFRESTSNLNFAETTVNYSILKKDIIAANKKNGDFLMHFYSNYVDKVELVHFEEYLDRYFATKAFLNNNYITKDIEGTLLLKIVTDYKGRTVDYEILGCNNERLQKTMTDFAENHLKEEAKSRPRFKNIKLENKKDLCTFLLPINFENKQIFRTFSRPNNYWWNDHWMWQQQMLWHQQHMQQMNQMQQNMMRNFNN